MEPRESLREVENLRFRFQMNNRLRLECLASVSKIFREFGEPIKDELLSAMVFALPQELISGNGHGVAKAELSAANELKDADRPGVPPDTPTDPKPPGNPPDCPTDPKPPGNPPDSPRPGRPPDRPRPGRPPDRPGPGRPPDRPKTPGLPPQRPKEPDYSEKAAS